MGIWSGDILDLSDPAETVDLLEVEGYSGLTLYFQQQALLEGCLYNSFIRSFMLMCPEWLKQLTQQSSN